MDPNLDMADEGRRGGTMKVDVLAPAADGPALLGRLEDVQHAR
jgi:hypothetical protein